MNVRFQGRCKILPSTVLRIGHEVNLPEATKSVFFLQTNVVISHVVGNVHLIIVLAF